MKSVDPPMISRVLISVLTHLDVEKYNDGCIAILIKSNSPHCKQLILVGDLHYFAWF